MGVNIIIKSDVHGSSEALKMAINKIEHSEVEAKIILSDIGMINETDVSLAKASGVIYPAPICPKPPSLQTEATKSGVVIPPAIPARKIGLSSSEINFFDSNDNPS